MDKEQQKQWAEAQQIVVSVNLVEAAKKHLKFLAAVDRNRYLYEDRGLQLAIYRYNAFWLPLLAKHLESAVRYKLDGQKLYGRILTNRNVISTVQATSTSKTEKIWNKMYPNEPYELDLNRAFSEDVLQNNPPNEKFTSYDLVSAVKRQISFTYQVSRPYMSDDLFLQEAEARYKGFLHLIRTNRKLGIKRLCVPTYDVDLMWHTHQLYPYYYCDDLIRILGKVLEHDDTDSDRSKGGKLDTGFSDTCRQYDETFGRRYWKAGAMYRGNDPTPVTQLPSDFRYDGKEINLIRNFDTSMQMSTRKVVEVFLEFGEIKNLPEGYKDNLVVSFSKKHSDKFFNSKRSLSILPASEEKQVAYFQCEPTGELLFELKSRSAKVLGCCSLSLDELFDSPCQLSADKWLTVEPVTGLTVSEPIVLRVSVSFTPPTPAPQVFHLEQSQDSMPFCNASSLTYVTDDDGKFLFNLQMSNIRKDVTKSTPGLLKEVHYITDSGEKQQVAEFLGENWVIRGMDEFFLLQNNPGNDDHLFELVGNKMVKLFSGRRLEFEPKQCGNRRREQDFVTAVEFSVDHPYGKAIGLLDLQLGTVKALDEWIVLPGITLAFLLSDVLSKKKYSGSAEQYHISEEVVKSSSCGGGKCGGGQCTGEDNIYGGSCGGGQCASGKCGGGQCTGEDNVYGGSCGGAKCASGKCVRGQSAREDVAYCCSCGSGECAGGKCGGGQCAGEDNVYGGSCGGGKCVSGNCGGGNESMVSSVYSWAGDEDNVNGGSCGAGQCASGKCVGGTENRVKSSVHGGAGSEDYVYGGSCGGGKCGGQCGGGSESAATCGGILVA